MKVVLIVGAGFAGLNAAKELCKLGGVKVILIDQRNHHLFQPLLYQVATAGLNVSDIAIPIRSQFADKKNISIHLAKVESIDLYQRIANVSDEKSTGVIQYDYLILACGSRHTYFGNNAWEQFAPGLKTLEQATEIRRRILHAFEMAENELNPDKQKELLTFVVIGGGATGVELAGAIANISCDVLVRDFKRIDASTANIILIEAGNGVLSAFGSTLSERAQKDLENFGVIVRTNTRVENITSEGVLVSGEFIKSKSVFWAAGVEASPLEINPTVKRDRAGRILNKADLSIEEFSNSFVLGDMAAREAAPGYFLPGLAPVAIQQGRYISKVIEADILQHERPHFVYLDKGQMATIGKNRAVMKFKNIEADGFIAWIAWLFVHVLYLVGFKNKFFVFVQWVWSYIFSRRGSRLILEKKWGFFNKNV